MQDHTDISFPNYAISVVPTVVVGNRRIDFVRLLQHLRSSPGTMGFCRRLKRLTFWPSSVSESVRRMIGGLRDWLANTSLHLRDNMLRLGFILFERPMKKSLSVVPVFSKPTSHPFLYQRPARPSQNGAFMQRAGNAFRRTFTSVCSTCTSRRSLLTLCHHKLYKPLWILRHLAQLVAKEDKIVVWQVCSQCLYPVQRRISRLQACKGLIGIIISSRPS